MTEEEERTTRARDRVLSAQSPAPPPDLQERLAVLRRLADAGDVERLLATMRELVPSFRTPEPDEVAPLPAQQVAPVSDVEPVKPVAGTFPVPPARA